MSLFALEIETKYISEGSDLINGPDEYSKFNLSGLQALCLWLNHSGLDQSASYEELLAATDFGWL